MAKAKYQVHVGYEHLHPALLWMPSATPLLGFKEDLLVLALLLLHVCCFHI